MQPLIDSVFGHLDAHLSGDTARPLALAFSGGGDSAALLRLAADWSARRGRRLLALTVDHGLHPDSARWTALAGEASKALGVEWRALAWEGDKPSSGLPAAARAARHALLADAARQAGASVILMAHTADDIAESDWMREKGVNLGRLRVWGPSPAWPQGRGVMILRPLLSASRANLRVFLQASGASWLEDPANSDTRFMRSRARAALGPVDAQVKSLDDRPDARVAEVDLSTGAWAGFLTLRPTTTRTLAAALICVSGRTTPPRGDRLTSLCNRILSGEKVTATLCGARIQGDDAEVTITREPGRRPLNDVALAPDEACVWDGRFEITARSPGWRVGALTGRMARLEAEDRAIVKRLPVSARLSLPILFRDDDPRPLLAWRAAQTRCLVADRFIAALGWIGHEDRLTHSSGETPPADLFLSRRVG